MEAKKKQKARHERNLVIGEAGESYSRKVLAVRQRLETSGNRQGELGTA